MPPGNKKKAPSSPPPKVDWWSRGIAHHQRGELMEAEACYRRIAANHPMYHAVLGNLGGIAGQCGRLNEAVSLLQRSLALKPDYFGALNNLGNTLQALGRSREAVACLQRAVKLQPGFADAYYNMGYILKDLGELAESVAAFQNFLAIQPGNREVLSMVIYLLQDMARWPEIPPLLQRMHQEANHGVVSPFVALSHPDTNPAIQQHYARHYAREKMAVDSSPLPPLFQTRVTGRLRIGYLSSDFYQHATAYLMAEVLEHHNHQDFEIIALNHGHQDGSPMQERLHRAVDQFVDLREMSDGAAAQEIRRLDIHILVDLKGYTRGSRNTILAWRPAPLQVNWLGYPGTLGGSFVDYILADSTVIPPGEEVYYDEKVIRLPGAYQPNDRQRSIAPAMSRAEAGLPPEGLVFCSPNQFYKISPDCFQMWMTLLKEVPDSVLWLMDWNRWGKENLRQAASLQGVDPNRLIFAPFMPLDQHLARMALADLYLDTTPYNGHTTMSDCLWVGVPGITHCGTTFAARVAASLLHAIECPELITHDWQSYLQRALHLAREPQALSDLRQKVGHNRLTTPLFDSLTFTRHLEEAYRAIWNRYERGQPADHLMITPHPLLEKY